jgi:tetratricopeptide (TPR) repeat protein
MYESRDLFERFNVAKFNVAKARSVPQDRRILVLGPPRSGKSTFINRYLGGCGGEHIVGLVKTGKAPGQLSKIEMIIKKLEQFFPLLERANRVSIDMSIMSIKGLDKLDQEDVKELKKLLGNMAPKYIVEDIASKIKETGSSSVIAYYIPWDINEGLLDGEVRKAVEIIKSAFKASGAKVKWLNAEYIPPGFVKEVLDLLNRETEGEVGEIVGKKVEAYVSILRSLGLLEGVEWESYFVTSVRTFIKDFAGRSLETIPYIAGNIPLGAFTTALITLFTNHIIKTPQSGDSKKVVDLQINLKTLKAEKLSNEVCGEFSELGKIVAYKIAAALNLDVEDVCRALAEIAGIEVEKLKEIVKDISKRITEVEKKVKELKKDVEELEKRVERADVGQSLQSKSISIADKVDFIERRKLLYPDIKVVDGKLSIRVEQNYYSVVEAGAFGTAINNLTKLIRERRVVVVVGPRGIGKSVLAASVIWRLFDNGDIGLAAKVEELSGKKRIYSFFKTFIEIYLERYRDVFGRLLILYDPSATMVYEEEMEKQPISEDIRESIGNLLKIINSYREDLMTLIVLPKDIYDGLGENIRNVLDRYKLKLDLRDAVFLAEVVKEYSEVCRDKLAEDKLSDLVNEITQFNEGHALIARLAGTLLAKEFKCNINDASKVVKESKYKATAFIAGFINSYFKINDADRARVLAEVFAIRKPFVDILRPGDPILTPGIVEVIKSVVNRGFEMPVEKAHWLSIRHHDLIEYTIENLLSKKYLGEALEVWAITKIPRITDIKEAVEYFINNNNYRGMFIKELDDFSWKRLALIAGHVLAGYIILPGKEVLSRVLDEYSKKGFDNLKKSLEEALSSGKIDYYLVVDNKIPVFVHALVTVYLFSEEFDEFWKNFVNREDLIKSIVSDAEKLLKVWSGRKGYYLSEALYALGLAVITSKAIELGKGISEEEASTILKAAQPGVGKILHPSYVKHILTLLRRLGFKAPQHYINLLLILSGRVVLDEDEVSFIFDALKEIHSNPKYFNKFKKLVWPLVDIVEVYSDLLSKHLHVYLILLSRYPQDFDKIEDIAKKMCNLLNILRDQSPELATIAEASVLIPSLAHRGVEGYVKESCSINDIIAEADVVLNNLKEMAGDVSKLVKNDTFMEWIEIRTFDLSEEGVREVISGIEGYFTSVLAEYKLNVDRLDEARELYNKAAEIANSIGDIDNSLVARSWILRVDVIKASNLNEYTNVAKGFEYLWNEALENLKPPLFYLESKSYHLSNYLVYLASIDRHRHGDVERLLNKYAYLLSYDKEVLVLTKLMIKILGYTETGISSREIVDAYSYSIYSPFLPALKLALGIEADHDECEQHDEELSVCVDAFLAIKGNEVVAMDRLKDWVLRRLGSEFYERVKGLDAKLLVQLLAPRTSDAQLAFMLYSLINGDIDLARRLALEGSISFRVMSELLGRLFREAYDSCCNTGDERFKLALLKLFYYHI